MRHGKGKEKPLYNTRLGIIIITVIAVIIAVLIWWFLRPTDTETITHVSQHVKPKIIVRMPKVRVFTAAQLHTHHVKHVLHLAHLHLLHVKHLLHVSHLKGR